MKTGINYLKGDATMPHAEGNKLLVHVCNDIGGWGKGFVMAISKRWPEPERHYREWYHSNKNFMLGEVQFVKVQDDIWVGNMIGQYKLNRNDQGIPPIRYEAVKNCLEKAARFALGQQASVHMPRIGCGLAGGTWDKMEPIIEETLVKHGIDVFVYDF